jgi:peptidoglycan/LPS O-acetylase OafA/YrhL
VEDSTLESPRAAAATPAAPAGAEGAAGEVQPVVAPPPGNPRFPLIDSVRAIAALCVFGLHASVSFVWADSWYAPLLGRLDIGVTFFFLISGFLLYRPFVAARYGQAPPPRLAAYARSRFLRIVPAYWLALTVLAIYPGLTAVFTHAGWRYYLFLQQYFPFYAYGGISQAWSLCVEVSFYLALPLLALLAARFAARAPRPARVRHDLLFLGGLCLFALGYRLIVTGAGTPEFLTGPARFTLVPGSWVEALPGTIDWFAFGMALAVISVAMHGRERRPAAIRLVERAPSLFWGAGLLLFVGAVELHVFADFPDVFTPLQWHVSHVLYGVIALLVLLPAVFGDTRGGLPRRVLSNRLLAWLGLVSYGIFLWHVRILEELADRSSAPGLLLVAIALAITVACAATSYYAVERPLLRFKYGHAGPRLARLRAALVRRGA